MAFPSVFTVTVNILSTGTTPLDIQKDDVAVSYNKETKTFTITGNLIYNSALTDYSSNSTRKVGYFAALDLDWSKMGGE